MAGQWPLKPLIGVRLPVPEPSKKYAYGVFFDALNLFQGLDYFQNIF